MELQHQPERRDIPQHSGERESIKRPATTPLQESRSTRLRQYSNQETPPEPVQSQQPEQVPPGEQDNNPNGTLPEQSETPANATENQAIRNILFPTFKNLRRLHLKLTTAIHHYGFLTDLRSRNQVPRGLKVKPAVTTSELPSALYEKWELAHIELSNTLRDIMIEHWDNVRVELQREIEISYTKLINSAEEEELNTISQLIDKATSSKREELKTRRSNKQKPNQRSATGASGTNQRPNRV